MQTDRKLRSYLLKAIKEKIPVYVPYLKEDGPENFRKFWEPKLKRANKNWLEGETVPSHRRRTYSQINRLVTTGKVPFFPPNMVITKPQYSVKATTPADQKALGLPNKNLMPTFVDYKDYAPHGSSKGPGGAVGCRVPTEEDLPAEWRRYDHNGRKVSLAQKCASLGFPPYETTEIIKKNPKLTIEEAGKEALKTLAKTMVSMNGKKISLTRAAEILIKQYSKFTYTEMLSILLYNSLNMGKVMKFINRANVRRYPVYVWDTQGFQQKFASVQAAVEYFGVHQETILDAIAESKQTIGLYFTKTDKPPTALKSIVNSKAAVMQLFDSVENLIRFSLSKTEYEMLRQQIKENLETKTVSENIGLTEEQTRDTTAKAFESITKAVNILLSPKGIKHSKLIKMNLNITDEPWTDHQLSSKEKNIFSKDEK